MRRFAQLLDQSHWLSLQTSLEPFASPIAGKSLTSSSIDMSTSASKLTPLKLNFLNVLFFGILAPATSASTSAMFAEDEEKP
ncbi:hypothetical protein ACFX13_020639 [Malus domestica]